MPDSKDEARALLDAYARATSPSPAEIEHSLTRTLARIESAERSTLLPNRRRRFVWAAAAGVATLVLATAAIAGIRWYRALPEAKPETYGAARFDQVDSPELETPATSQPALRAQIEQRAPPLDTDDTEASQLHEPTPAPEPIPDPAPGRRARPRPSKLDTKPAEAPKPADASMLAEESRLLAHVRRALRDDDFEAALEWAEEHARRHPQGSLTEERLILEAVAACRGDQRTRGLAAAKQLRDQFPKTAALAKVEQACAE